MCGKKLSKIILWVAGWKNTHPVPNDHSKFVLMIAPHTSTIDFLLGWLMMKEMGLKAKFLIKKEVFWFPLSIILKRIGGISVDRSQGSFSAQEAADALIKGEKLVVAITPEATRKKTSNWKKGFYRIAIGAGVPVGFGYLDYKNKRYGITNIVELTGNFEQDILPYIGQYADKNGRHPEKFSMPNW